MNAQTIYTPTSCKLDKLNNLFIELTAKNCNQRCKTCYLDLPYGKQVKDFINIDKIKQALVDTKDEGIRLIHLMGAEPMTHPDFNSILRLCLKRADVVIHTNATFINEKKARFLKKVEGESTHRVIFELSLNHFNEVKNDDTRYRGAYREVIHAMKFLDKYDFEMNINALNFLKIEKSEFLKEFEVLFDKLGLGVNRIDVKIPFDKLNINEEEIISVPANCDCKFGRVLSETGVYACPFLSSDSRGRMGANFKNFSDKISLDTPFCAICAKNSAG